MYYETAAELVVRVHVFVEAESSEEADKRLNKYIQTKKFQDYCKKQITANEKSNCVVAVYNDNCTKEAKTEDVVILKLMGAYPVI